MNQLREKAEKGQLESVEDAYYYSLTLMSVELLRCSWHQVLEKENFSQVEKISIILPFTCHWNMKDEIHINPNNKDQDITYTRKNNISIEKTIIKLGYKDIINVQNILKF